ncbi:hypothetical protein PInf_013233 [Phytophthora infestans]|nr:hypothetical protein PInf_013233 [Phytophthora infestans]
MTASYIAHAKKVRAGRLAAKAAAAKKAISVEKKTAVAEKKKAVSKKKMTKRRVAEIRRDEKQAKESRAIARATSAVAARAEAKKSERARVADEEIRGGQAREQALAKLQKRQPIAAEKGKRTPKPAAKTQKRSKTTSPQTADDGVNDQDPSVDSNPYVFESKLSLSMDVGEADINNTAVDTVRVFHVSDEDALKSDEEERNNSEDWYTELVEGNTGEDTLIGEAGDGVEGDWSDDDPDGECGANLLRLQKNRSQRELLKQRVATAKARVSRD